MRWTPLFAVIAFTARMAGSVVDVPTLTWNNSKPITGNWIFKPAYEDLLLERQCAFEVIRLYSLGQKYRYILVTFHLLLHASDNFVYAFKQSASDKVVKFNRLWTPYSVVATYLHTKSMVERFFFNVKTFVTASILITIPELAIQENLLDFIYLSKNSIVKLFLNTLSRNYMCLK